MKECDSFNFPVGLHNVLMGMLILLVTNLNAQSSNETFLNRLHDQYERGYLNKVVASLDSSFAVNIFENAKENEQALELLARSYIGLDYTDKAKEIVEKIIKANPEYEPDTPRDLYFQAMVWEYKAKQQRGQAPSKKYILYAALSGAVITSTVAYFVWPSPKEKLADLPNPPNPPANRP